MLEVFRVFFGLGLTSFGGPTAHLGFFRHEFVVRRGWLSETEYADLVALCQFLPGPASSQVGIAIGTLRCGTFGGIAAWLGFTLPSALLMALLGLGLTTYAALVPAGLVHGLQLTAIAVVVQAVWSMAQSLCPDRPRRLLALASAALLLVLPAAFWQIPLIIAGALFGCFRLVAPQPAPVTAALNSAGAAGRGRALLSAGLFLALLLGLPLLAATNGTPLLSVAAAYYLTGSLVFGGGHVVLPLLEAQVVTPGWISAELFAAGYGAAQAMPGPLFTLAAFLGAAAQAPFGGWPAALTALAAIFLPAFLLVWAALPLWLRLRAQPAAQAALSGVNAVVVGMLLAALYSPLITSTIRSALDVALVLAAFAALTQLRLPPWLVVIAGAAAGVIVAAF